MDIRQSYELPFAVNEIYTAWVSSATVISPATAMEIEPVVGGCYRLIMAMDEGAAVAEGRFQVVEPDKKLRYTWEWNADGEVSVIDVTFAEIAMGSCIDIHHSGFANAESAERHAEGWDRYIEGLAEFLARQ
ncbi:MAG: SRPBCC family protein [Woeseiaceae bacterium]